DAGCGRTVPVVRGCRIELRAAAPVEQAPDDPVRRVVVRRLRILVHVEAGKASHTRLVSQVRWPAQPVEVEGRQAFADVLPVERRDELLVEDAVPGQRQLRNPGATELIEMALPEPFPRVEDGV